MDRDQQATSSRVCLAAGLVAALLVMPAGAASGQAPAPASGLASVKTVFIILMENHDWRSITPSAAPYIRQTLVPMGAHAEQYFNPPGNHPSEPNYVWLEAGDNLGLTTDHDASASNSTGTVDHLVSYLEAAGVSWRAYQEDISGTQCPLTSAGLYAAKHNPFVFFRDVTDNNDPNSAHCIARIRPYGELATDLQNNTVARYNFITPNLCNDMHDCSVSTGDVWLSREVPKILGSQAYRDNGALFVTWDEGEGDDGPIGMVVVSPLAKAGYSNSIPYTHSSTLRTMQEIFGVGPFLRDAANATDLSDLFAPDVTRPSVAIISPTSGQTVSGVVTITASASDDVGVTRIDYLVDGQLLAALSPPAFTFAWSSATVVNGPHALSARAYDAAGNVGTSTPVTVTVANVNPVPAVESLSPSSATAGGASFTLTVTGGGFVASSVVQWNGTARTTTLVSTTELHAAIASTDIAAAGAAQVTVITPAPGGGTSTPLTFTINNPAPTVSAPSPTRATAGGAGFTLTVTGRDFVTSSVVRWNGVSLPTAFRSTTMLQAAIGATDIARVGTVQITVFTPSPGGGTSAPLSFTVDSPLVAGFTDPSLAAGTVIRAVHITELRAAIDDLRLRTGLASFPWTGATLVPGSTPARGVDVLELRSALGEVYQALGRTVPSFTDATIEVGATVIKADHIREVRLAAQAVNESPVVARRRL